MTEIFRTIAGSRLYGTHNENSDTDYKAVHLPTARELLLRPKRDLVRSTSSGGANRNGADDVDVESFELQRYLKLTSDMQTIPVEMLFINNNDGITRLPDVSADGQHRWTNTWHTVRANRHRILNRNNKAFVGYCKGQAVRYSMRGKRLDTFIKVVEELERHSDIDVRVYSIDELRHIEGVRFIPKVQPGGQTLAYLDVYGRQVPGTMKAREALKVYRKPVDEAGNRAHLAQQANGADWKALYHAVRIAEQGVRLFETGDISFPCQNTDFLLRIRGGEMDMDEVLDHFDGCAARLEEIGDNSPLAEKPDKDWIDDFVFSRYEQIVRNGS